MSSAMERARTDPSLQVLFGKAFLVELRRGDLENAKVMARAFLLQTPLPSEASTVNVLVAR